MLTKVLSAAHFGHTTVPVEVEVNLSKLERKIVKILQTEPLDIDEIAAAADEKLVEICKTISLMGLKGLMTEFAGRCFSQKS